MRRFYRPLGVAVVVLAALGSRAVADRYGPNGHATWLHPWNPTGVSAPEIDPRSLGGAVALLASGILILRDRRRR